MPKNKKDGKDIYNYVFCNGIADKNIFLEGVMAWVLYWQSIIRSERGSLHY